MFKVDSSIDRKMMAASLNMFYGIIWDGFCLDTEKGLFAGVSF